MVEMRDRFTHREKALLQVDRTPEQYRHQLGRCHWLDYGRFQFRQARGMVSAQLLNAGVDANERKAMRGKHQRSGRKLGKTAERVEKPRQWVSLGLHGPDTDIGANFWQQHVAGNEHVQCRTIERSVLRRMSVTSDDLPAMGA